MSLTKNENEKLVDLFSGKGIVDPFGPNPKQGKPEQQESPQEEISAHSYIEQIFTRKRTWGDFWKIGFFN